MLALRDLLRRLGSPHIDCRQDGAAIDPSVRAGYLFNSTLAGVDAADALLLIGTNPRWEAPVLNQRIRKRYLQGGFNAAMVGENLDLTYRYQHLGEDPAVLSALVRGEHEFAAVLKGAKQPMLILGMGALARPDGAAVLAAARELAENTGMIDAAAGWNGFNVLHTAAARVGGLDLGFVPGEDGLDTAGIVAGAAAGDVEVLFLLGADEIDTQALGNAFVVYQGHHGDAGAHRADVILPGAAYTEKNATYVNTEGRVQTGRLAVFPPGEAREDWAILRALSSSLGKTLPYDNLTQVRAKLVETSSVFANVDRIEPAPWRAFAVPGEMGSEPFRSPITNFYMTDPISRVSKVMAECTEAFVADSGKTGTDG